MGLVGTTNVQLDSLFAEDQALGFGLAIIIVTLLVRFIILPLGIYQSWKVAIQSEKMNYLKPILGPIQERMKMQALKKSNLSRNKSILQLKTIRCEHARRNRLFADADSNAILLCNLLCGSPHHRISEATFLGINLGSTSLILTGVAGILYYAQSLLMQVGMDEEQKNK